VVLGHCELLVLMVNSEPLLKHVAAISTAAEKIALLLGACKAEKCHLPDSAEKTG